MKHAKNMIFGELKLGTKFIYTTYELPKEHFGQGNYVEEVGIVTSIKFTKTGRVTITVNKESWMNGPCSPNTAVQQL
tara:strand:- start:151 stop:381 length:231 start_codon:yes stop_codon:yes gene_type:complete